MNLFALDDLNYLLLPLPANAALGIGYGGDGWSVEFDVVWTDWSDFDELILDFENESTIATGLPPPFPPALPLVEDQTIPENWDDTFSWRVGFGYSITAQHEFRAGLYFDENPIPDETMRASLPDADRWSAQVGYGFTTGGERFGLDAYYQFIRFDDRTIATVAADESVVPGDYETDTSLLGASARFRF